VHARATSAPLGVRILVVGIEQAVGATVAMISTPAVAMISASKMIKIARIVHDRRNGMRSNLLRP